VPLSRPRESGSAGYDLSFVQKIKGKKNVGKKEGVRVEIGGRVVHVWGPEETGGKESARWASWGGYVGRMEVWGRVGGVW